MNDESTVMSNNKPDVSVDAVTDWLITHLDSSVHNVEPLAGGFWSAAFAFEHGDDNLVVRFNQDVSGFEIDRAAHEFASKGLPVPEVIDIGQALGVSYAISHRYHGDFLENVDPTDAPKLRKSLADMFMRLRSVPAARNVQWYDSVSTLSWHEYLQEGIGDQHGAQSDGWYTLLEARPEVESLYKETLERFQELLPVCPERRDLIHCDLLHQNVLISENAEEITALFSWKCSAFGDFMYDIAWCTHWAPWHPGITALDVFGMTLEANDLSANARKNIAERHHCYELHIAASHIGWYLWTGNDKELDLLTTELRKILDRGPVPA